MRLWPVVAVLTGTLTISAQEPTTGSTQRYDPAIDATIESLSVTEQSGVRLQVTIVYAGRHRAAPPNRVELLIARDTRPLGDARTLERSVGLFVDGQPFRRGTLNARDVYQTNAVAMVFGFDDFSELAHAHTIDGQAFGVTFALPADQIVALQTLAERWASPSEREETDEGCDRVGLRE